MAIIISENEKKTNWLLIGLITGGAVILAILVYYLFFSSAPLIEKIIPPPAVQKVSDISKINLDPATIQEATNNPIKLKLQKQKFLPPQETFGRPAPDNPFSSFQK